MAGGVMKKVCIVGAVLAVMFVAAPTASARPTGDCWCVVSFAHKFVAKQKVRAAYWNAMGPWLGSWREKVRSKVYDYEKTNALNEPWCKRHPKWCKALKACLAAGGATIAAGYSDGSLSRKETVAAGAACGIAAWEAILLGT